MPTPTSHDPRFEAAKHSSGARILVVDDDADGLKALARVLCDDGFDVTVAHDGPTALAKAQRSRPDVVLTDLQMDPMSGVELCKALRERGQYVPVIVMTAHSDIQSAIDSMHAGVEDYFLKPLDGAALKLCIERVLTRVHERAHWQKLLRELNERLVLSSIREQQRAEAEALHRAQLEALLENVAEGVIILDTSGNVKLMNGAGRTINGLAKDQVVTLDAFNALEAFDVEGRPLAHDQRPLVRAVRGEEFTDYEIVRRRPSGERRHIVSTGTNVRDDSGRVVLALVVFRDVTELRRLEQQREEYVALISHDLRNPLSSILGFVSLLRSSLAAENSRLVDLAERAQRNVKRMTAMLDELTEATTLEGGAVTMEREPSDLRALATGIVSGFEDRARNRIRVDTDGSASFVVLGDAARLERVIANLLTNALKYSADDAPVRVCITNRDGVIALSVTDRGIGIAPEHHHALFDRFYRTTAGRGRAGGLGLGLYIARLIVEAHGGRIHVSSELGAGSTFTITLPARGQSPASGP